MKKIPIRDLHGSRQKRFCDAIIKDDGEIYLEQKHGKGKDVYTQILWDDVVSQVNEAAKKAYAQK